MAMNARVTTSARASSHLCASARRLFFRGSDHGGLKKGGGGGGATGGGGGGGSVKRRWHQPQHRRGPQHGHGRGAPWQLQSVRARLDVAVRPDTYREELDLKIERARAHFSSPRSQVGDEQDADGKPNAATPSSPNAIPLPPTEVFESARSHFRMRAEFRVWHEGDRSFLAMFDSDDPKQPVEIPSFPMGSERINQLMPALLAEIKDCDVLRTKLFQVNFLTTVKGDAMVSMLYHRRLTEEWEAAAEEARARLGVSIIGRSRKQKVSTIIAHVFVGRHVTAHKLFSSFFLQSVGECLRRGLRRRRKKKKGFCIPMTIKHESYHRIFCLSVRTLTTISCTTH